ncbi:MAG TPA: SIS domain-containing protein [Terriglobia bacterium]|nr:SIS domain-containing protein [Terriglobia bacterium]
MMEEILQQPAALGGVRKFYASPGAIPDKALRKLVAHWPPTVVFTGMGSSLFAAYPAQAFLTSLGIRTLVWETAELLHHHMKTLHGDTLLVAVSQSGETVEIVRLLDHLPARMGVVGVANVEASTLARRASLSLPMMAGRQTSVSTKTYTCAVAALMYLAFVIARRSHRPLTETILRAMEGQESILDRRDTLTPPTLEFFDAPPYVALMSRGADLASAYQGALMFKEVARLPAEPISAAQFRHGPIEIVQPAHRYIVFARRGLQARGARTAELVLGLARDIQSHGGKVLLITDQPFEVASNTRLIKVEPLRTCMGTLVDILFIQLLVHDLARRDGREPGRFWIAEGVTRTE